MQYLCVRTINSCIEYWRALPLVTRSSLFDDLAGRTNVTIKRCVMQWDLYTRPIVYFTLRTPIAKQPRSPWSMAREHYCWFYSGFKSISELKPIDKTKDYSIVHTILVSVFFLTVHLVTLDRFSCRHKRRLAFFFNLHTFLAEPWKLGSPAAQTALSTKSIIC